MSGILNMVSRFARGRTTGAGNRRPAAGRGTGVGTGRTPRTGRNTAGLEGLARRFMRHTR